MNLSAKKESVGDPERAQSREVIFGLDLSKEKERTSSNLNAFNTSPYNLELSESHSIPRHSNLNLNFMSKENFLGK